jgi:phage terminase Nu1 subunit (DNA packaging protein)
MPKRAKTRLNLTDYAKHRKALGLPGGTLTAVRNAIADGRIVKGVDGKIDAAQADADWLANTGRPKTTAPSIAESKARFENERAIIQRLKRKQLEGRLVDVDDVRADAARVVRAYRDQLLSIPERLASVLAGLEDPHDIRDALDVEIRQALEVLGTSQYT